MENYLKFAKELAKEAEEIALRYFDFNIENTWKEDDTPLTKADTEINDLVIKRVNETYPSHSICGEEKSDKKDNSQYVWVCDPIDGTMPFSCGLPIFTFSLALIDQSNGQPILGIVNDPVMKNMYWAYKDGGTYRNNEKISVAPNTNLFHTYLNIDGSGRSIEFSNTPLLKSLSEKKCRVMTLLSVIYWGIQVANGKFVGTVFYHPYPQDVAALKIITEEAWGKVTDLNGEERRYDQDWLGCLISNGILHDELLQIVQSGKIN